MQKKLVSLLSSEHFYFAFAGAVSLLSASSAQAQTRPQAHTPPQMRDRGCRGCRGPRRARRGIDTERRPQSANRPPSISHPSASGISERARSRRHPSQPCTRGQEPHRSREAGLSSRQSPVARPPRQCLSPPARRIMHAQDPGAQAGTGRDSQGRSAARKPPSSAACSMRTSSEGQTGSAGRASRQSREDMHAQTAQR